MEYLTFDEYCDMGGELDEREFNRQMRLATVIIDDWTMERLTCLTVIPKSVKTAMLFLLDYIPAIEAENKAKAEGSQVSSFSNGVNSFSFSGGSAGVSGNAAEKVAYDNVARILPVELVSRCVYYNRCDGGC